MNGVASKSGRVSINAVGVFIGVAVSLSGQTTALRGVISDETGAVIPDVNVIVTGSTGTRSATSANDGSYLLTGLPPGEYSVEASTPALALPQPQRITLSGGIRTL